MRIICKTNGHSFKLYNSKDTKIQKHLVAIVYDHSKTLS